MSSPPAWQALPRRWRKLCFTEPDTVLLESTLPSWTEHHSYLFRRPLRLLIADASSFDDFWLEMERALADGLHLAGFLTYEAGALLQGIPAHPLPHGMPLAIMGAYPAPEIFDHLAPTSEPARSSDSSDFLELAMMPTISVDRYTQCVSQIQRWIAAGDTYQLNYTMQLHSRCSAEPAAIYDRLAMEQPCSYSAALHFRAAPAIISFSPELFFRKDPAGQVTTRPMKGTAPRSALPLVDVEAARALPRDEKNRAEHVMIVDLLRNDLGKICEMGSVRVDDLFHVETYPTVHQMISTVSGRLTAGQPWRDIFAALFPSGSITGAPKHHTMHLIHQVEPAARGLYTVAIGHIAPDGSAAFSVAIRSVVLHTGTGTARMGVGGGIVADSLAAAEYRECLLKAEFVRRGSVPLQLVETMRSHNGNIPLFARHLHRLSRSATALGFSCDAAHIASDLAGRTPAEGSWRLRLTLAHNGTFQVSINPITPWPATLRLRLSSTPVPADQPSLQHKTTSRPIYDTALRNAQQDGFDEALFLNTAGELTEGCISNLLLRQGGRLLTPPLESGVLPGIYRGLMLENAEAEEAVLTLDDLRTADQVYLCNSVRGLGPVGQIVLPGGEVLQFKKI